MNLSRREFVQMGGTLAAAALTASCQSRFAHDLACQLYTLRSLLPDSAEATLRTLSEIGYREVEAYGSDVDSQLPLFRDFSLRPVSIHFSNSLLTDEGVLEEEIDRARQAGFEYGVIPSLPSQLRGDLDAFKHFAEKANRFGELCKTAGIMLCYHNHAFEFQPMEGTSPLEVMMDHFEVGLVGLELDAFWSSVAGVDPVGILNRYEGRVPLIHLKDKAEGTKQTYDGNDVRIDQFKEVGNGVMDIPGILRAAQSRGVRHYIVEQDHCAGDPLESVRASFDYLTHVSI